ncbi:MAG: hypothetical protein WCB68_04455 [Pyrinomonadaceae bacterium]
MAKQAHQTEEELEVAEIREREERCRIAILAALFAARELQLPEAMIDAE